MLRNKHVLTVLIIFIYSTLMAQDYRAVIPNQQQFFEPDTPFYNILVNAFYFPQENHSPVKVMYFDSATTITNGIARYSFNTWEIPAPGSSLVCVNENGPAWVGAEVHELINGTTFFFNSTNDTIRLETTAGINDTWHFYNYQDGSFVKAKIDSLVWMQLGTISDSVKCISLNVFASTGTLVNGNYINGKNIWLSKNNGLLKTIIFRDFPNNSLNLHRSEVIMMPTQAEIFDFNINDEFEYTADCPGTYYYNKILAKTISSNNDTVIYAVHEISVNLNNTLLLNDTVNQFYPYHQTPFYNTLPEQNNYSYPDSSFLDNYEISIDSNYNYLPLYISISGYFFPRQPGDSCYLYNNFEPVPATDEYVKGLGQVESSSNGMLMTGFFCETKLIWYHKGNNYWGNAVPLVTGLDEIKIKYDEINLYPNPNNGSFTIKFPQIINLTNASIEVYSIQGDLIYSEKFNSTESKKDFQITVLKPGIYTCKIISDRSIFTKKIIVLQ